MRQNLNERQIANALSDIGKAVRRTSCKVGLSATTVEVSDNPVFKELQEPLVREADYTAKWRSSGLPTTRK